MGCGCGGSSVKPLTPAEVKAMLDSGDQPTGPRNPARQPGYTWNGPAPKTKA